MSGEVFVNIYIENLLNEVSELTKSKVLLQTQLAYAEKQSLDSATKIRQLEEENESLAKQIESLKSRKAKKEDITS